VVECRQEETPDDTEKRKLLTAQNPPHPPSPLRGEDESLPPKYLSGGEGWFTTGNENPPSTWWQELPPATGYCLLSSGGNS